MLAIVGVAAVALGTGFLNNNIELWIQEFGVGSGDIESPVDHVQVDFRIIQQEVANSDPVIYENVIDACLLTLDVPMGDSANTVKLSELTCKLTGHNAAWQANDLIITEGTVCAPSFGVGPHVVAMGVAPGCPPDTIIADTPTEVDVRDVGDVIVVAHANTYSAGEHTCEPGFVFDPTVGPAGECVDQS